MNKRLLLLGLAAGLLLTSCQPEETQDFTQQKKFNINTSEAELDSAINFSENGVIGVTAPGENRNQEIAVPFAIQQIGYLAPPQVGGTSLRATHVDVKGDFAYVSYNKEGAEYLGAIDVVDVSDHYAPKLISRMTSEFADVNSLYIDDSNKLVFTGASSEGEAGKRTFLAQVDIANGLFNSEIEMDSGLQGNAGVHVLKMENRTIFLSGNNGIIGSLEDYTTQDMLRTYEELALEDLRYAQYNGARLAVLSGVNGLSTITFNEADKLVEESTINTKVLTPESKRTLTWYGDDVLVAEGNDGAGVYNFDSGSRIGEIPLKLHPDAGSLSDADRVTNAVSTDGNFIYMANGGAGLDVLRLDESLAIRQEGIADLTGSANFVQAKGEYIYLATGTGLRILKIISSEGTVVASEFLECESYKAYTGNKNLTIPSDVIASYSGMVNLKHLNVNGTLNVCGDIFVEKSTNLSSQSLLNLNGNFTLGNEKSSENLVINSESTFRIAGSMTIYGDLYIESGGSLAFVGEDSEIYVSGEVKIKSGGEVTGEFEDLNDKF